MANPTWTDGGDNWSTAGDWTTGTVPGAGDNVTVAKGNPQITSNVGAVGTVADTAEIDIENGGSLTTQAFTVGGQLHVDANGGQGGGVLTSTTLTNTGTVDIGNSALSAATTVIVSGNNALVNGVGTTVGTINLAGSATNLALIQDTGSTTAGFGVAGSEVGNVSLSGDSEIQFGGGEISTIRGTLDLSGANARIADIANQTTNSALTGLSSNIGNLNLENGGTISTTQGLSNTGTVRIDSTNSGQGGSTLGLGGTLTNSGTVDIGDGASLSAASTVTATGLSNFVGTTTGSINVAGGTNQLASLVVGAPAGFGVAGTEVGNVALSGDALIQFTSGSIGAVNGQLDISGPNAFVADAANPASNSALSGLQTVSGTLNIENGAAIATGQGLTNSGNVRIDDTNSGQGGSTLGIGGVLTNSGNLQIGDGNLTAPSVVTATGLTNFVNTTAGTINVSGSQISQQTGTGNIAELDITQGTAGFGNAGVLTGSVALSNDALIQFAGGQIGSIAANSQLDINGANAFVADAADPNSNSALTGLASNAGNLNIENGAAIAATQGLTNTGTIRVDNTNSFQGGSSMSFAGALTNSGALDIGDSNLTAPSIVTATAINNAVGNSLGTINLSGSPISTQTGTGNNAELNITQGTAGFGTAGVLNGTINMSNDALIQFSGGEIGSIAANSQLDINGANAFIADAAAPTSNSALTGLMSNAGNLNLENGASINTTQGLTNTGTIRVDNTNSFQGGSSLKVGGVLTNGGSLFIGDGNSLTAPSTVTATGLLDAGGTTSIAGALNAQTNIVNTASLIDTGSATGGGTINLNGYATAEFGGATDNTFALSQTTNLIKLDNAAAGGFTGTITGFGVGDTLDLANEAATITSYDGTTLTVQTATGTQTYKIAGPMSGGLTTVSDGNGGTDIIVCYVSGTLIRTTRGDVPVESLAVGDLAITASGAARPITWLGHRTIDCRRHQRGDAAMPVRIAAHAFGENRPARDLRVSPGHAICVDVMGEVLIPASALVNGASIVRETVERVTYWHVELDSHDILLAENLPSESYVDVGNRDFFVESGLVALGAAPDAAPHRLASALAGYCRPFAAEGALVDAVRERLAARLVAHGWRRDTDLHAGIHLVADGRVVEPEMRGHTARFAMPAGATDVWLVSRTSVPAHLLGRPDTRALGVCLRGLAIEAPDLDDGRRTIAVDDALLQVGFHAPDGDGSWRWTAGRAHLPAALWAGVGDAILVVDLAGPSLLGWLPPPHEPDGSREVRARHR